ncbi:hypothetical protein [Streptomyces sp. NPDC002250]|uniref:hypothetical protein n=1 Tax=Streptomyces sp. NPDC002250 TaxID=3364641 RepID=UPI0036C7E76C
MGMFDEIHAGHRCGQTKAFGRTLAHYRTGDAVQPVDGRTDVQIAVAVGGGWLQVRGGRIHSWEEDPAPDLPPYDNAGRPLPGLDWPYAPEPTPEELAVHERRVLELLASVLGGGPVELSPRGPAHLECGTCAELRG